MTPDPPPPALTWSFATPDDVPELVRLIRSAYRGEASRAGWTSEADLVEGERTSEEAVRRLLDAPGSRVLLAREEADSAVACCHVEDRGHGVASLGMFAVAPERQAAGVGRWLLAEAERAAAEVFAARRLEISVLAPQAGLIAWYERRGFTRTGERRPFPADARFARALRDDLEFIVMGKAIAGAL
ncbi:MAG TPA: GNAT family N-acetyltransferase [Solirubrobacteraceae bacterium]|nr:GNAT family N-acetyltransferase [Solirubrobacteraceae bacterium]